MKIQTRTVKRIYMFIVGFLGFSMLGQYVVMNVLHIPFAFMELFFLPLLIKHISRVARCFRRTFMKPTPTYVLIEILLIFGLGVGLITTSDFGIIMNYRTIIYMLLVIMYVRTYSIKIDMKAIYWVNLFAVLGDFVYINLISNADISSSINCVAIGLAILSGFTSEKYLLGCLATALGFVAGITSGFRLGIIVPFIALAEALLYVVIRNDKKRSSRVVIRRVAVITVFICLGIIALTNYEKIIHVIAEKMGMSSFAVFRVIDRMMSLLSFDFVKSQDVQRIEIYMYPIQRFLQCIIPRGLIGESIGEYWLYIDVPSLYLYDLVGSIGTVAILFCCAKATLSCVGKVFSRRQNPPVLTLAFLMMPILLFLLIINGTFMVVVFQGVETAAILGLIFASAKQRSR